MSPKIKTSSNIYREVATNGLATLAQILTFSALFSTLFYHFLIRNFAPQNSKARKCEGNKQEIAGNSVMKSCRMKNSWIWEFNNVYKFAQNSRNSAEFKKLRRIQEFVQNLRRISTELTQHFYDFLDCFCEILSHPKI